MKTKILLVCPFEDGQSGAFLYDSFIRSNCQVAFFDWRELVREHGPAIMNKMLIDHVKELKPELTLIIKGYGITAETIKEIRKIHDHKIFGWIFDITLGGTMVKDVEPYVWFTKELDIFYTMDNDAIPELKELGVNAKWLPQGCDVNKHQEVMFNAMQRRQFGSDVVFMGSVGGIHPNREALLKRIADEGINLKIYGDVLYPEGKEPDWVKDHHTGFKAVDDIHSLVCGCGKIVLGCDGWPGRDKGYSLRLYKVLCAGGFYLTTHTKGIEEVFTPGEQLETYKSDDEMIEKILKYLQDDKLREKIAKQGQVEVLKNHLLDYRIVKMLKDADLNTEDFSATSDIISKR